ncbi:MAG: hypothetical protein ABGW76_03620 [Mesonia sp.]|uniref:hypothetical protein n=1 Tax=Mesonia sp. TaxID=1960830 RepID=UPI00324250E2
MGFVLDVGEEFVVAPVAEDKVFLLGEFDFGVLLQEQQSAGLLLQAKIDEPPTLEVQA